MARTYKPRPASVTRTVTERIHKLFQQAQLSESKELSDRYVKLARTLSMKYKVKMPSELKKQFCKHCNVFLRQGKNARVRRNEKGMIYTCLECNKQMRFPIRKK